MRIQIQGRSTGTIDRSPMAPLQIDATGREVYVRRGINGTEISIDIINDSKTPIAASQMEIEVDSPGGTFVRIGQAVRVDDGVFRIELPIKKGGRLHLPVWIERSVGGQIKGDSLDIRATIDGEIVDSCNIDIVG